MKKKNNKKENKYFGISNSNKKTAKGINSLDLITESNIVPNSETNEKKRKTKFKQEEYFKQIDTKKVDEVVESLWRKFVFYFKYTEIFEINNHDLLTKHKENSCEIEIINFDLKLITIFSIYKIKKSKEDSLVSNSEEGSYLLKHAKIWIIYINNLKEYYNYSLNQVIQILSYALEYGVDEYILFDFFMILSQEYEEDELSKIDITSLPRKFVEMYKDNKDHIHKVSLQEEFNIIDSKDVRNFSFSNDQKEVEKEILRTLSVNEEEEIKITKFETKNTYQKLSPKNKINLFLPLDYFSKCIKNKEADLCYTMKKQKNEFAKVINSDVRKSGNFAIFELSSKSQEKINHKFILTPLKKKFDTFNEVEKDLKEIHIKFPDFVYHPFCESISEKLQEKEIKENSEIFKDL
jgi:hypothetical protein